MNSREFMKTGLFGATLKRSGRLFLKRLDCSQGIFAAAWSPTLFNSSPEQIQGRNCWNQGFFAGDGVRTDRQPCNTCWAHTGPTRSCNAPP